LIDVISWEDYGQPGMFKDDKPRIAVYVHYGWFIIEGYFDEFDKAMDRFIDEQPIKINILTN